MRITLALLTSITLLLTTHGARQLTSSRPLVIVGATLLDGTGAAPVEDSLVFLNGGRITRITKKGEAPIPSDAAVISAKGKWLVPGLIDAHIHFFQSAGLFTRPDVIDLTDQRPYSEEIKRIRERIPYTLSRYICSGVTSVVDMGGPVWTLALKETYSDSDKSPRITAAGPLLSTIIPKELQASDPANIALGNPDQARAAVRQVLREGADFIKIWFIDTADSAAVQPSIRAAVSEAHAKGFRVAVHATELALARQALEAGADILVHSVEDQKIDSAFVALLKKRNVIYIPTLMVKEKYDEVLSGAPELTPIEKRCGDPEAIASWAKLPTKQRPMNRSNAVLQENLRVVAAAGITIASGSDAGNIGTLHGPALHRELELMVQAGLSPQQVLVAATRNAARVAAPDPKVGTIEVGQTADLLLLGADPLKDIRNLSKIEKVIKSGHVVLEQ